MTTTLPWQSCVGAQRDWVWRGWQTRYSFSTKGADPKRPPMLFLHGFGASIGHWKHNLPFFSKHHAVYALDLLGFGGSEKANTNYNAASLWAEQVYDFWRTFIKVPVILVGNSLGSLVSLIAAARYPQMVRATAMINLPDSSVLESPVWLTKGLSLLRTGLFPALWVTKSIFTSTPIFNPFFRWIRQPSVIRFWVKKAYSNPDAVTDELVDILVNPTHDRGAARALKAMFIAKPTLKEEYLAKSILPRLTIPMLLIWGKQDMLVPPKLAPLFVRYNKALQLIELDNAGHCPQDECPDVVNDAIATWIERWLPKAQPVG
ncbi:MAG: alpha/beta fold hydrolase [Thermosynechococcaceae cyanobacterium]